MKSLMQRPSLSALTLALAGAGTPLLTHAQAAAAAEAAASAPQTLPAVRVRAEAERESATGPALGYAARRSATATKTDTPLSETPQSVTVVTRERIEDQGATSTQDALNYAAGVRSDAYGLDSRSDSASIRGGLPVEYLDGLRQNFNYYTSSTRTEPYMLERIEVLRGPAAMLFGQGSTAGILHYVSKRPLDEAQREVGVQFGTFGRKQVQADLTGPLTEDGQWLYRLVALARDSETQVDHVDDDRKLLAPSITWRPSAATSWTLQLRWQDDHSGSTLQFFPWSGTGASNPNGRIPTHRFIGQPSLDRYDSERVTAGWLLEHRLEPGWTLRQNLRYTRNEVEYVSLYADAFSVPGDSYIDPSERVLNRFAFGEKREVRSLMADQHVEGRLVTGGVEHRLLAGLDVLRYKESSQSFFDGAPQPIDVYDPVYPAYTPPSFADDPDTRQRQVGFYLQDQMHIGDWIVVAGARRDRAVNRTDGGDDVRSSATTKRLGVMHRFSSGWAPYLSYSESFTPVPGTDAAGDAFAPVRGKQYELGLKFQPEGAGYSFTASVYDLREKNRLVADPANPAGDQIQAGKTRARGAELELVGRVTPQLDVSAHYNYLDFETDDEAAFDPEPPHQAAVWGTYRFRAFGMTGWSLGLGLRHFGAFRDGAAPRVKDLTLADAALAWDGGAWRYALNVQNLADKTYVSTCLDRGDCFYGARRHANLTATYRF